MEEYTTTTLRLVLALVAGGLVGLERTFNGRPAGFRTHSLVCMASSLLMLLTVYQWELVKDMPIDTIRIDPTRMAQGLMTGIGFLGAGVIMKENFAIRGLTTAASIWITAAIGVLIGIGLYFPAALATVLSLGILSVFRSFERRLPTLLFARVMVHTPRATPLTLDEIRTIVHEHRCTVVGQSYHLESEGKTIKYELTIHTRKSEFFTGLAETFARNDRICQYSLIPRGG